MSWDEIVVASTVIVFFSSSSVVKLSLFDGQDSGSLLSQSVPFHQRLFDASLLGLIPLEARSAGFSADATCLHMSLPTKLCISLTRFPTKVCQLLGLLDIHARAISESHHAKILCEFISRGGSRPN